MQALDNGRADSSSATSVSGLDDGQSPVAQHGLSDVSGPDRATEAADASDNIESSASQNANARDNSLDEYRNGLDEEVAGNSNWDEQLLDGEVDYEVAARPAL